MNAWTDARALRRRGCRARAPGWREACPAIALAINSAACLLDLEGVIIDGSFGRELLDALMRRGRARARPLQLGRRGTRRSVLAGTIGSDARAIGGALLPLYANFAPDRDLFLKIDKMNGAVR